MKRQFVSGTRGASNTNAPLTNSPARKGASVKANRESYSYIKAAR